MATVTSSAVGFLRSCLQYSRHRQQKPKGKLTANKPLPDTDTQTHMLHPHTEIQTDKCHTHTHPEREYTLHRETLHIHLTDIQTLQRHCICMCTQTRRGGRGNTHHRDTTHTTHTEAPHTHTHRHRMLCKRQNCILLERKVDRTSEP